MTRVGVTLLIRYYVCYSDSRSGVPRMCQHVMSNTVSHWALWLPICMVSKLLLSTLHRAIITWWPRMVAHLNKTKSEWLEINIMSRPLFLSSHPTSWFALCTICMEEPHPTHLFRTHRAMIILRLKLKHLAIKLTFFPPFFICQRKRYCYRVIVTWRHVASRARHVLAWQRQQRQSLCH